MREDYQVHFSETVLKSNLQSVAVTVSTESSDPRAAAFADKMQESWERYLPDMCDAIGHGRVAFEESWGYCPKTGINYLRKLDALPFRATEMLLDEGRFAGIKLTGIGSLLESNSVTIPVDSAWWLALDATVVEPHGKSRFLGAPRAEWEARRTTFTLRLKYLRKFMLRGGVIRGPAQVQDARTGEWIDTATAIAGSLDNLREGGFAFFPDTRDKSGNFLFEIDEPPKLSDPTPIETALDKSDVRMLRSFGISELSVQQTGDLGSFAMAVMHRLILNAVVGGIVSQFAWSFDEYCVRKGIGLNWYPEDAPDIAVTFPDLTAVPDSLMVEVAKAVLTSDRLPAGAALANLRSVFDIAGIPITDDFDARLESALSIAAMSRMTERIPGDRRASDSNETHPQRGPVGLANDQLTRGDGPQAIPDAARLLSDATERLAPLFALLFDASLALRQAVGPVARVKAEESIKSAADAIRAVVIDTQIAGRLLGMLSPWVAEINESWSRAGKQSKSVTMALLDRTYQWPWMQSAIDFLLNKQVANRDQFAALDADEKRRVFEVPEVDNWRILEDIKLEIAVSMEDGESLESFRDRMQGHIGLAESQVNTLFRTNTHQAYIAGQDQSLNSPTVADEFPCVMYAATSDTRTRPAHSAVDGFVVRRNTREHEVLMRLLRDYNCRCTLVPLREGDALRRGIKSYRDIPDVVLDAVGLVSSATLSNSFWSNFTTQE